MSERRILVIGSQCEALQHLGFLPNAAQDLYAVMTDPERGACVTVVGNIHSTIILGLDEGGIRQLVPGTLGSDRKGNGCSRRAIAGNA